MLVPIASSTAAAAAAAAAGGECCGVSVWLSWLLRSHGHKVYRRRQHTRCHQRCFAAVASKFAGDGRLDSRPALTLSLLSARDGAPPPPDPVNDVSTAVLRRNVDGDGSHRVPVDDASRPNIFSVSGDIRRRAMLDQMW